MSRTQFWRFLRNPAYIGKIQIKAYLEEEEQLVDGIHEGIISNDLFEKVQRVLDGKSKVKSKPLKINSAFPLRGYLICPKCNKILTASRSKGNGGQYSYYHCQSGCKERQASTEIHNTFLEFLSRLSLKKNVAELYQIMLLDSIKNQKGSHSVNKKSIEEKISSVRKLIEKVDEKYISDNLDSESYKRLINKYKSEIAELQNQISRENISDVNVKEIEKGFGLLTNLKKFYEGAPTELKQKLISSIFPEKLIFQNKTYRTTRESEILRLLFNAGAVSEPSLKNENRKNLNSSGRVARAGIEPAFPP